MLESVKLQRPSFQGVSVRDPGIVGSAFGATRSGKLFNLLAAAVFLQPLWLSVLV